MKRKEHAQTRSFIIIIIIEKTRFDLSHHKKFWDIFLSNFFEKNPHSSRASERAQRTTRSSSRKEYR